jgi:methylisocitrate lyase
MTTLPCLMNGFSISTRNSFQCAGLARLCSRVGRGRQIVDKRFFRAKSSIARGSAGARLRAALEVERPLQVPGVINAYAALLAEKAGFQALYLSGAGVAVASHGLPDLGVTTLTDVLTEVKRITSATSLPLLVDADTGWEDPAETVRKMIKAGAAGIHIEDQVEAKRCGHRPNKQLVGAKEMADRIRAAVRGKTDPAFVLMARTDAVASEGLAAGIARARQYQKAGADMIFAEALTDLSQYREFVARVGIPVLANITEFGKTPLFMLEELRSAGVSLALYPLSAFRAMSAAALKTYRTIRAKGSQKELVPEMQTRADLYELLNYSAYEQQLDKLFKNQKKKP